MSDQSQRNKPRSTILREKVLTAGSIASIPLLLLRGSLFIGHIGLCIPSFVSILESRSMPLPHPFCLLCRLCRTYHDVVTAREEEEGGPIEQRLAKRGRDKGKGARAHHNIHCSKKSKSPFVRWDKRSNTVDCCCRK